MKAQIIAWLNGGQTIPAGLEIIKSINSDDYTRLALGSKSAIFQYLIKVLNSKAEHREDAVVPFHKDDRIITNADSELLRTAKRKADKLYKEMSNLRALAFSKCSVREMNFENDGKFIEERADVVRQIMKLQRDVDVAYDTVEFVKQYNRLPEPPPPPKLPGDNFRIILNCRKYISKLRNGPQTPHNLAKLAEKEAELKKLLADD